MLTKDEAKTIWGPVHGRIAKVVKSAWDEWKSVRASRAALGYAPVLYQRTVSNHIFDAIARNAIAEFGVDSGFMIDIEAQTFKVAHKGCVARFKKAGDDLLGQNHPTQAVLDFVRADGMLPGFPPGTGKIEFVWCANELFTDLQSIHVVARDGDSLIWEYEIDWNAGAAEIVPLHTVAEDIDEDTDSLVTLKRGSGLEADKG